MSRTPIQLVSGVQISVTLAQYYATPAGKTTTITAAAFNNVNVLPRSVTVHIVPSGGTAGVANQYVTTVEVAAAGQQPTQIPGLVGQVMPAGSSMQMLASADSSVAPLISGFETTL